ncbi:ferrous iron transport protein B [Candidatus Bathyarchaeota archaeon]|nr:ferrous iron transport protein B [Candidatus Bathyarchaeota archaeon]
MDTKEKGYDYLIALAGNPNTGKSTIFNALTGLRQHVGNWPGKTVERAEGSFKHKGQSYRLIDLPGTYSLLATATDEEIARNFLLFGHPDVVVVVVDSTSLERNLNLVLQVLEISNHVVVCLNLVDEAARKGIKIDVDQLSHDLGVPVVPTVANVDKGLNDLVEAIHRVAPETISSDPHHFALNREISEAVNELSPQVKKVMGELPNIRWVTMRLLEGETTIRKALENGELMSPLSLDKDTIVENKTNKVELEKLFNIVDNEASRIHGSLYDQIVTSIFVDAETIASKAVIITEIPKNNLDAKIDRIVTSRIVGFPIMIVLLMGVFWITIEGANIPSKFLADGLFWLEGQFTTLFRFFGAPYWLEGLLVHGAYRSLAWVVSVMLPPMAIFFPLFTILEDLGYLPRVAFNVDRFFKWAGAHGKQSITMCMGFGCNAAGVISCRSISSPRERLIAVLTNNFAPCNGRWPTLILMTTVFIAPAFPQAVSSLVASIMLVAVTLVGMLMTFIISAFLSHTLLRGESSFFVLEMPSYRRPNFSRVIYTSFIDRAIRVLYRAVVWAAPAGAVIWILGNSYVGGESLMAYAANALSPIGLLIGLDGIILLAYIIAIPANEIVIPTIIMGYMGTGMITQLQSSAQLHALFVSHGFNIVTAICLMLFSVLHYPCSTTTYTIWKETKSAKWTILSNIIPLTVAFIICFIVAQSLRSLGIG